MTSDISKKISPTGGAIDIQNYLSKLGELHYENTDGQKKILLTKCEGRTGRISARGLDNTDRAQRTKKDQGPIFSQYGPEQDKRFITRLKLFRRKPK